MLSNTHIVDGEKNELTCRCTHRLYTRPQEKASALSLESTNQPDAALPKKSSIFWRQRRHKEVTPYPLAIRKLTTALHLPTERARNICVDQRTLWYTTAHTSRESFPKMSKQLHRYHFAPETKLPGIEHTPKHKTARE